MSLMDKGRVRVGTEEIGRDLPMTPEENFVMAVYSSVDEAVARTLHRLHSETGIVPSCKLGCCHCCRYRIVMNIAEVRTLAQYVKREFTSEQREALRRRAQQWHEWDACLRSGCPSADMAGRADPSDYDPCCPLLINGACGAYGVRPIVCRAHFVSSLPLSCDAANDQESQEEPPQVIEDLVRVTHPFSMAMKAYIEEAGWDYSRSMTLLPHGLAAEMGWDFAVSP
jgi:hypothetical protein